MAVGEMIRQAWALACVLGHSYVGSEHFLLAAVMTEPEIAGLLLRQEVGQAELLYRTVDLCDMGARQTRTAQGFSPHCLRALAAPYQTPKRLLAELLRAPEGGACRVLRACGVDTSLLFSDLCEEGREKIVQNTRLLEQFGVDLVQRATELPPVVGRRREIETVLQILSRKHKNNPALIGEPGVGKTAIVEGVAQYIAQGRVPEQLQGKRLFSLDMASVIAGTKYRGEFEERVRDILAEVRRAQNVILFVDEMHTLVGAGAAEGAIDAANLLKPALGRGELQLIGATTLEEYRKCIEKDAALERRFRTVQVDEPSREATRLILRSLVPELEAHHHISLTEEAVSAAVELSCRYLADRFLPDKALDLLDEAAARAKMARLGGREEALAQQLHEAVRDGAYERAAELRNALQVCPKRQSVTRQDIAATVAARTGIPVGMLTCSEKQRLLTLEQTLSERVIGQEAAVRAAAEAVRRGRSGLAEEKRPAAAMLFLGPTGVGKTELCKALACAVYGSEQAMIRIDMSEYMEKFTVSRLIGAPPGYVGHEQSGELSERVRRKPYSLVLLDELEKAHRDVCNLLLQIMEDGVLTDSCGRKVNFKNVLLVMTSNIGSDEAGRGTLGFGTQSEDRTLRALREHFSPEFLGRIDCIASFRSLGQEQLRRIAQKQLDALSERAGRQRMAVSFPPEVAAELARRAVGKRSGAREVRRLIQTEIEAPLARDLLRQTPPQRLHACVQSGQIALLEE